MSLPRQVLKNSTYLITRRCSQRCFFLRPDPVLNAIILFCAAYASNKYGIQLHAICALSNHVHIAATDPDGNLPMFCHSFFGLVARATNALRGRFENMWDDSHYSAVRLERKADVLDKLVYLYANPVAALLVKSGSQWPGVRTDPRGFSQPKMKCPRPGRFFRQGGKIPEAAALVLHVPPQFDDHTVHQFETRLAHEVRRKEAELVAKAEAEGRKFMGAAAVLAQDPFDQPKSKEPRFETHPHIACRDAWAGVEAIQRREEFILAYAAARKKYVDGDRTVQWPEGTYWMVRHEHYRAAASG